MSEPFYREKNKRAIESPLDQQNQINVSIIEIDIKLLIKKWLHCIINKIIDLQRKKDKFMKGERENERDNEEKDLFVF